METHIFNEAKKRFEPLHPKCTFCMRASRSKLVEENCFFPVYNVQKRTNVIVYRNVRFNEVKIGLPRCASCKKLHDMANVVNWVVVIIGIFSIFIVPIYISVKFDLPKFGMIVLMALCFGLTYLAMKAIDKAIHKSSDVLTKKEGAMKEPLVLDFLRNGWSVDRPRA